MCYVKPYTFPERTGNGIRRMDPTERVQYVLRNVFGMNAVDGITHILFGRNYEGECEHASGGHTVVKTEHP